jgi:energy-coupling factor transporter ATP-binding protein EcfA2
MGLFKTLRPLLLVLAELLLLSIYATTRSRLAATLGEFSLFASGILDPVLAASTVLAYSLITAVAYDSLIIAALNGAWFYIVSTFIFGSRGGVFTLDGFTYFLSILVVGFYFIYVKMIRGDVLKYFPHSIAVLGRRRILGSRFFPAFLAIYFYALSASITPSFLLGKISGFNILVLQLLPINILFSSLSVYITSSCADSPIGLKDAITGCIGFAVASATGLLAVTVLASEFLWYFSVEVGYRLSDVVDLLGEGGLDLGFGIGVARKGKRLDPVKLPGLGAMGDDWYWGRLGVQLSINPEKLANTHVIVIGSSGMGKSTFVKNLVKELASREGLNIMIFDPHGEYIELAGLVGNVTLINPWDLGLNILHLGSRSPRERARRLSDIVAGFFNLGPIQRRALEDLIVETYRRKGILEEDRSTWSRQPPTLRDLVETCVEESSSKEVYASLLPYVRTLEETLSHGVEAGGVPSLLEGNVIVDLSSAPDDYAKLIYVDLILQQALGEMHKRGLNRRLVIVVEEAASLTRSRVLEEALSRLYMESRKFGFSIISVVQNPFTLPESIIMNSGVRVVFGLGEPRSISYVARLLSPGGPSEKLRLIEKTLSKLRPGYYMVSLLGSENIFLASKTYKPNRQGVAS